MAKSRYVYFERMAKEYSEKSIEFAVNATGNLVEFASHQTCQVVLNTQKWNFLVD